MIKIIVLAALAALMGADAFVSPVATSFSGSAVATRVSRGIDRDGLACDMLLRVWRANDDVFVDEFMRSRERWHGPMLRL